MKYITKNIIIAFLISSSLSCVNSVTKESPQDYSLVTELIIKNISFQKKIELTACENPSDEKIKSANIKLNDTENVLNYIESEFTDDRHLKLRFTSCDPTFSNTTLELSIINTSFLITLRVHSEIEDEIYYPIYQQLIINDYPKEYDQEIIGHLEFRGISRDNFQEVSLSGDFKFFIERPKGYIYRDLAEAIRSKEKVTKVIIDCNDKQLGEIGKLKNLKSLIFNKGCRNRVFTNEIFQLPQIEILDFEGGHFEEIPLDIGNLTSLKSLDLRNNRLKELPKTLQQCKKLEKLYLEGNRGCDFSNLQYYNTLKELDLEDCNLKKIPNNLQKLVHLENLVLSKNLNCGFSDIPKLKNLKHLNLSYCDLKNLPSNIEDLHQLETLSLSGNPQLEWNKALKRLLKLPNLKELNLQYCELKKIPKELFQFKKLDDLNLWNNDIIDFKEENRLRQGLPNTNVAT